MQKLMGLVRRCVDDYNMIQPGDKIAVGVSGGKDSLVLLVLLAGLREYFDKPYSLEAITIDMGLEMDYSGVEALCRELNVPYHIVQTQIAPIIFDHRKEKNPCSMCAKMRRGALNQAILDLGFNKLALGHHYDDAVETFVMNLLFEGRIGCFQPVTNLDRTGIIQIFNNTLDKLVKLTLNNATIDQPRGSDSSERGTAAIDIQGKGNVQITVKGDNRLTGNRTSPAIQKNDDVSTGKLTITAQDTNQK